MSVKKLNFNYVRQSKKTFTSFLNEVIQNIPDAFTLGLYCYLSTLPPEWQINRVHIMKHFKVGRDKIGRALKWLNDNFLIEYEQVRFIDGTVGKVGIVVNEGIEFIEKVVNKQQSDTALLKNRTTVKPVSGETAPIYNTSLIKKNIKREDENFILSDFEKNPFPFDEEEIVFCRSKNIKAPKEVFTKFYLWMKSKRAKFFTREQWKLWLYRESEYLDKKRNTKAQIEKETPNIYSNLTDFTEERIKREIEEERLRSH